MAVTQCVGGLGPKQLEWCKRKLPAFNEAWKAVKAAEENAARVREKLEGKQ